MWTSVSLCLLAHALPRAAVELDAVHGRLVDLPVTRVHDGARIVGA